jgi:hypothetical protein
VTAAEFVAACDAVYGTGFRKPTLPEVRPLVAAYYQLPGNGVGGALHVVLEDANWQRSHVRSCMINAPDHDQATLALGRVMLKMSNSQRRKLTS